VNKKQGVIKFRFVFMQAAYWCTVAAFFSFLVVYLRQKGISAGLIGIIIASYRLSSIGGQIFWGNICDRYQSNKKVYILTNILIFICSMMLFKAAVSWQMVVSAMLLGFCQNPTLTNMDTWLLKYYNGSQAVYGPALAAGSLAYGIFIFFYGRQVAGHGFDIVPYFLGICVALSVINAAFTPEQPVDNTVRKVKMNKDDIKILFKNQEFIFLLIILFFVGFTMIGMNQIKPMIWEYMNAGVVYQGYDSSAAMVLQTPVFFAAASLSRIAPHKRLTVAVILYLVSVSIALVATVPMLVVFATMIGGMGYGILLPSMREIIRKTAPEKMATTAQGLGDAVFASVSGMTGAILSGVAIDFMGFKSLLIILLLIQIMLLIFVLYKGRKEAASV